MSNRWSLEQSGINAFVSPLNATKRNIILKPAYFLEMGSRSRVNHAGNFANKLRTKGDEVKRRNKYAQELHNINYAYCDEKFTLHKNHTGRYWKEVYATRYNTRDAQQTLSAMQAHDIYELNAHNWHRTARWA